MISKSSSGMQGLNFGDLGHSYTLEICSAISEYTRHMVELNPKAFIYRGMNLRFAVERQLYIRCINSVPLFSFYAQCVGRKPDSDYAMDSIDVKVARHIAGAQTVTPRVRIDKRSIPGHSQLRWLYRMLRSRQAENVKHQHRPILINIIHPKFAKYLRPIVQRIAPENYAYLVNGSSSLADDLGKQGEPCIVQNNLSPSVHSLFFTSALRDFENLVEAADSILAAAKQISPKCLVVVEGNAPQDILVREAGRLLSIPTYCIQQGWSPVVHTGFRNMDYDLMFVWGARLAEILAPYNPEQKFIVSGSHALDVSGVAGSGHRDEPKKISFFLQSPCALLSVEGYLQFIELIIRCAEKFPQAHMIVREHPSYPVPLEFRERMRDQTNIVFSDPGKDALGPLIKSSVLVASVFSTVLMEAVALGTVPLVCNIGSLPSYEPDLVKEGAALEIHTIHEAVDVIGNAINHPESLDPIRSRIEEVSEQYFSTVDAAELIGQRLLKTAELEQVE